LALAAAGKTGSTFQRDPGEVTMLTIILIIVVILLLTGGGFGYSRRGRRL
jgi:hypothetical protein